MHFNIISAMHCIVSAAIDIVLSHYVKASWKTIMESVSLRKNCQVFKRIFLIPCIQYLKDRFFFSLNYYVGASEDVFLLLLFLLISGTIMLGL